MAVTALTKPNGPTGEFNGDIHVDNTPPNKKMLEKAKGLTVLDHDKKKYSFQTLYEGKGRILMVFIRNFFCGVSLTHPTCAYPVSTSSHMLMNL